MATGDVTELLQRWSGGDPQALERLLPLVHEELRRMADQFLRHERVDHTLQPTALVHELYLKMVDQDRAQWQDREHSFSVAAKMMRRILVDHARKHITSKRGAGALHLPIHEALDKPMESSRALLAVDAALTRFAALDPERSRVVELRYFGGLVLEEIASLLQVSRSTVKRQWTVARMWLHRELEGELHGHEPVEGS